MDIYRQTNEQMKALETIRAEIRATYGYDPGDSGAMMIFLIGQKQDKEVAAIEAAAGLIRQSQRPLQSDNPWACFCYGLGRKGIWVLPILVLLEFGGWVYSQQKLFQDVQATLARYPNARMYELLMKNGKLRLSDDGTMNLVLRPARTKTDLCGTCYVYNKKESCVYVPLYYKAK